jgi:hypothetical protein
LKKSCSYIYQPPEQSFFKFIPEHGIRHGKLHCQNMVSGMANYTARTWHQAWQITLPEHGIRHGKLHCQNMASGMANYTAKNKK